MRMQEAIDAAKEKFNDFLRLTRSEGSYREVVVRGMSKRPGGGYTFVFTYSEPKPIPHATAQQIAIKRALGSIIDNSGMEWVSRRAKVDISARGELLGVDEPEQHGE